MKKIEAVIRPVKLEDLKDRVRQLGVKGATVLEVKGFGRTGGKTEVYRGSTYVVDFVPKVNMTIVVEDDQVPSLIEAIIATVKTGAIGDGKIFVSPVDDVIRIRTGEHGVDAL
jgi:nitrogen regulatory protein P-II 1